MVLIGALTQKWMGLHDQIRFRPENSIFWFIKLLYDTLLYKIRPYKSVNTKIVLIGFKTVLIVGVHRIGVHNQNLPSP